MLSTLRKYKLFLSTVIVLSAIILTLFYSALKPKKMLPIYNPSMVNPELVDSTVQYISKYHTIADNDIIAFRAVDIIHGENSSPYYNLVIKPEEMVQFSDKELDLLLKL